MKIVRRSLFKLPINVLIFAFEDLIVDVVRFSKWVYYKKVILVPGP